MRFAPAMAALFLTAAGPTAPAALDAAALCVVKANEGGVRRMLDTWPTSADDALMTRRALARADGCDADVLARGRYGRYELETRGVLAEALLKRRGPLPDAPPPERGVVRPSYVEFEAMGVMHNAVAAHDFARCLVRADWAGAKSVLAAPSGSTAERAAMLAMRPKFAGCLGPESKLGLSQPLVRALIGEAVFHAVDAGSVTAGR